MKIGLVLSGGFARGAVQAGFLKGMLEHLNREEISLLSCSSIGGLNGISLSDDTMDSIEFIYRSTNFQNLSNVRWNLKNRIIDKILEKIVDENRPLQIPLYITGTCLNTLSTHYFLINEKTTRDELEKAINITLTFPFVNGLFRREYNRFYLDGGATDNIPVFPFYVCKMDLLIILHCYPKYLPPAKLINSGTIVVDIDVSTRCRNNVTTYSFKKKDLNDMFDDGYRYGQEFGERVFADRNPINIKTKCQEFIREEAEKRKTKKVTLTAAVFFNKLQQSRGFKI